MDKGKIVAILEKTIEWSLYLMIFCLPFSKTIIEITITVALLAWIAKKVLLKDFRLKKTPLNISLFAFFIACVISLVNADNKFFTFYALITKCLKWIILYFIIIEEINSDVKIKNLLKITLLSGMVIAIDAFIQYYYTHVDLLRNYPSFKYRPELAPYRGFPTGSFPFPNDLSAWILVILIPALILAIFGVANIYARIGLGIFSSALLYLFYLANTRSAWLGFVISFGFILILKRIKLLLAIILLILAILPFLPQAKTRDILATNSLADRFAMWKTGWKIFSEHPVIGNGLNTFFGKFKEFREDEARGKRGSYAHNGFLQIAADIGLVGLIAFLAILTQLFYRSLIFIKKCKNRFYQSLAIGLGGGLLAFLIHSFFDTNLHSLPLVALFWLNVGVLMSLPYICPTDIKKFSL
ncbi:MAG: O-antigen ligase family protein [Candidatus Omnitrophota bacterium]